MTNSYNTYIANLTMVLYIIVSLGLVVVFIHYLKYMKLLKKFGKKNAIAILRDSKIVSRVLPKRNSDSYSVERALLDSIGWKISVEKLFILRIISVVLLVVSSLAILRTNTAIKIREIKTEVVLSQADIEKGITLEEAINHEVNMVEEIQKFLSSIGSLGVKGSDPDAKEFVKNYLDSRNSHEDNSYLANRLVIKVAKIEAEINNYTAYFKLLIYAIIIFLLPNIIILIKLRLMEGQKDWEVLHCMIAYSVSATLPSNTPSDVVDSMMEVSSIYSSSLEDFKTELIKGKEGDRSLSTLIENEENSDMQQLLETLAVANDLGVLYTVDSVDDQIENKIEWLAIDAVARREVKVTLSFIFIVIVFIKLFEYLMYNINAVNSMLYINL